MYTNNNVRNDTWNYLNNTKITNLIIGGHSLGGGIANILTADITLNKPLLRDISKIYTLAAPYSGNKNFVDLINTKNKSNIYSGIFNIINNKDVVPTVKRPDYSRIKIQTFCFSYKGDGSIIIGSWHITDSYIYGILSNVFDEDCAKRSQTCGKKCN
jgi:hypothetical protein